jgi:UDP-3-O-[3-hydroxymyristoyl] glucosamine N-acyltransferase
MTPKVLSFPRSVVRECTAAALLSEVGIPATETSGNLEALVRFVAAPDQAAAGCLVFVQGDAAALPPGVIVVANRPLPLTDGCCIVTPDPRHWFVAAIDRLFPPSPPAISRQAAIADSAIIAENVSIGPFSVIGEDVSIGEGTRIGSHVVVHDRSRIGRDCAIQDHSVIGSSGVAYYRDGADGWYGLQHLGIVDIGDRVLLGAHCVVVRGILYDTVIEADAKLGNFVNIGHNTIVGRNSWITSGAVIAGRVSVGDDVQIAAGACIRDKVAIGSRSRIGLGAIVTKNVTADSKIFGNPGRPLPTLRSF